MEEYLTQKLTAVENLAGFEGLTLQKYSNNWLNSKIKEPDKMFCPVPANNMQIGKFYWMLYDMESNNKMIQYSPIFLIDYRKNINGHFIFGISLNFLPIKIRLVFFQQLFQPYSKKLFELDSYYDVAKEPAVDGIKFENMYALLKRIGFEWAIREYPMVRNNHVLIQKAFEVSFQDVAKFLTIDTSHYTGVREDKIGEIWLSKLKDRDNREKEMLLTMMRTGKTTEELKKEFQKGHSSDAPNTMLKKFNETIKDLNKKL